MGEKNCWREKEQIWEVVGREGTGKGEEDAVDTKEWRL